MREFKDIILRLRTEKGFTQGKLADELGTSKSTVGMWEMGERYPSKELYEAIADYFNVDMDYLYGRSEIRKKIHFDENGEFTNDELEEIKQFAEFVKNKRNRL